MAEPDRLQLRKPLAAAGAARENRELVAYQLAAAAGEDRRPADQARPVLLADAGREPSHTPDCSGAWSGASGRWRWRPGSGRAMIQRNRADQDVKAGEVFVKGIEKTGVRDFGFCESREEPRLAGSET